MEFLFGDIYAITLIYTLLFLQKCDLYVWWIWFPGDTSYTII